MSRTRAAVTVRQGRWQGYPTRELTCDVLVVGGGLAGLLAARAAARNGARVVLACKGYAGADGVSVFAGGVTLYLLPGDDWEAFLAEQERHGEGLCHPPAVAAVARANSPLWEELARLGAPLERDGEGRLRRRWLRIGSRTTIPRLALDSVALMKFLRRLARREGVRFLDQTVITRLLVVDGAVRGAAGFGRQTGELVAVRAGAVVLAAGGCSWRGAHMGQHNVQGEGYGLALAAGAELMSMEFCVSYVATCSLFDTHGQCVLAALGGRFRNAAGEDILARHGYPNPAPTHLVARAILTEIREGRGPIYFDLTGIPAADRRDWESRFPLVAEGLRRTGVDVFARPVPWLPGFTGSIGGNGGVRILDLSGATGVPGLYAAGDTAARTALTGAGSGLTFLNVAWAAVSGHWAGEAAARHARAQDPAGPAAPPSARWDEETRAAWQDTVAPLERPAGAQVEPLLRRLQALTVDPEVNYFRTGPGLKAALTQVEALWGQVAELKAADWHDLARCHELRGATLTAHAMFLSALARTESRGWHYRVDHPRPNDERWRRWTVYRAATGRGTVAGQVDAVPLPPAGEPLLRGVSGGD